MNKKEVTFNRPEKESLGSLLLLYDRDITIKVLQVETNVIANYLFSLKCCRLFLLLK